MDYPGTSKYLDPLIKFVPTIDQQHEGKSVHVMKALRLNQHMSD